MCSAQYKESIKPFVAYYPKQFFSTLGSVCFPYEGRSIRAQNLGFHRQISARMLMLVPR